jgi:hypothetical protein
MTADMSAENREAVRLRLESLAASNKGVLTPAAVVEDAKNATSPLHAYFTWDTAQAAYQHWIEQARTLIRSVRVEIKTETKTISVIAFVRDPNAGSEEQGYVPMSALQSDRELARAALINEFGRVGDMLRRARELAAALDAQEDVEDLLDRVTGLRLKFMESPRQQQ